MGFFLLGRVPLTPGPIVGGGAVTTISVRKSLLCPTEQSAD